ncbi:MAG: PTS sugar transporter subunit IIC, partial [Oscillospiraceae bacterium]|nr:PTS sugar transporter subunit IIC [Oscillospiraceae bacterium]
TEDAIAEGAAAIIPGAFEWVGLILVCIVLPAIICWALGLACRKIGWIKENDLKLD